VTQPEIFEYLFKRAMREIDDLIDLAPDNDVLRQARAILLQARPGIVPPAKHHTPWTEEESQELTGRWMKGETVQQIAERFRRSEQGIAAKLQKIGLIHRKDDAFNRKEPTKDFRTPPEGADEKDSEIYPPHQDSPTCPCRQCREVGPTLPLPFTAGLDFRGRWYTQNGFRAEVYEQRKDGAWEGFVAGHGVQIWDEDGRNENPKLSLKDRVRPASKEAQGEWSEVAA